MVGGILHGVSFYHNADGMVYLSYYILLVKTSDTLMTLTSTFMIAVQTHVLKALIVFQMSRDKHLNHDNST